MTVKLVYFLKLFCMARIKLFKVNLVIEKNSPLHSLETNVTVGFFPFLWLVAKIKDGIAKGKTG